MYEDMFKNCVKSYYFVQVNFDIFKTFCIPNTDKLKNNKEIHSPVTKCLLTFATFKCLLRHFDESHINRSQFRSIRVAMFHLTMVGQTGLPCEISPTC